MFFANEFDPDAPQGSASASVVRISDVLDPQVFFLDSVRLGPILAGNVQISPEADAWTFSGDNPRVLRYEAQKPSRDGLCIIHLVVRLDLDSGALEWVLDTLDPSTGAPPKDPSIGLLPPDRNPPEGQGAVFFTVRLREDTNLNTITNIASITFDAQPPIIAYAPCEEVGDDCEKPWANAIVRTPPEARVTEAIQVAGTSRIRVAWDAIDAESGVRDFMVHFCEWIDGQCFWQPWLSNTAEQSAEFDGVCGRRYGFACMATDRVGNTAPVPSTPEYDALVTVECGDGGLRHPGDANGDGRLDISDAVATLGFLFLGSPDRLPCGNGSAADSANVKLIDWQPDGKIDITDAVAMLSFRFLGGRPHALAPEVDPGGCVRIVGCTDRCGQ